MSLVSTTSMSSLNFKVGFSSKEYIWRFEFFISITRCESAHIGNEKVRNNKSNSFFIFGKE